MIKTVIDKIGIKIDEKYKWKDTIFLDKYISSDDIDIYNKCECYIDIKYNENIDYSKAREIDHDIYCCEEYVFDKQFGVKIYFEKKNKCVIESNQECNEWLVIMIQIMLLKLNYSFIHAASVSKNQKAILLPSWGGVGKTACVSKLVDNGYKLLGDDLNIISGNAEILGFPKAFVLYFYHKDLFTEIFEKNKIKCGNKLNKFYNSIIPSVKKILRKIPFLLSYARKHNPQSKKVSPYEIFGQDKIEKEAFLKRVIWLDRSSDEIVHEKMDDIADKATAVTINEIFTNRINVILIMCGFDILNYDEIFIRWNEIYKNAFKNLKQEILNVPREENVAKVAEELIKIL